MKKFATIDDYHKLAAIIYADSEANGTGCLIWSDNQTKLYCLTANHCTFDIEKNNHFKVSIQYKMDENNIELTIVGKKLYKEGIDLAIYEIEQNDLTKEIPVTYISDLSTRPSKVQINSFPITQSDERILLDADYNSKTDKQIVLNIKNLNSETDDKLGDVIGVSGSGCYETIGKTIKLFGIENKARDVKLSYNELHAIELSYVNEILSVNDFPKLPKSTSTYLTERFGEYKSVEEVIQLPSFANNWVDLEISNAIYKMVEQHFISRNELSIYLCGFSGIGKTRGCINACYSLEFGNAIYYENYNNFILNETNLKNYARNNYEKLYIIIDEVVIDDWKKINSSYYSLSEHFKFIAIGTVSKKQSKTLSDNAFFLDSSSAQEIRTLIKEQFSLFDDETLNAIYKLSYNDLRLAILIAELYDKDNTVDYSMSSSSYLQNEYTDVNAILERNINQNSDNPSRPNNVNIKDCFNKLSLFVDIDITNNDNSELYNLSQFFGDDIKDYLRSIDYIEDINLGIRKGKYFELSPRALAKLAFEQQGWGLVKYELDKFMNAVSSDVLKKRFYDRIDECGVLRSEIEEELASWFLKKYQCSYGALKKGNANEIMLFIEHKPDIGLKWLKEVILSQPNSKILENYYYFPRREIVWTCEHLANFKKWFFDCEEILYKLACNEVEHGIANNSKGVWAGYFSIYLANTEIDFFERYTLLIDRATKYNGESFDLFSQAFSNVFSDDCVRYLPPNMVGGVITPENWQPKTRGEICAAKKYSLTQLEIPYNDYSNNLKDIILECLFGNSWSFISFNLEQEYKNSLTKFLKSQKQKNLLIVHLENQINIIDSSIYLEQEWQDEKIQFISKWIEELKVNTLIGRVDEYLSRDIWSHGYTDEDKEKIEVFLDKVAIEILANNSIIKKILFEKSYDKQAVSTLAEKIGKHDTRLECYEILELISDKNLDDAFLRGYFLGYYNTNKHLDEKLINYIDVHKYDFPEFVLWVSCRIEVNLRGFNRILELVSISEQIYWIDNLSSSIWIEFLSLEQKVQISNSILNCGNELKYNLIFKLLVNWTNNVNENDFIKLYKMALISFESCIKNNGRFDSYSVIKLFENTPVKLCTETLELVVPLFDFDSLSQSKNIYYLRCILKLRNSRTEDLILRLLGESMLNPKRKLKSKAYRGFFDKFEIGSVKKWIDIDSKVRAPLIAYHLSSPSINNDIVTPMTEFVLSNYCQNEKVLQEFCTGEYNLVVYSVESIYSQKDIWNDLLEKYRKSNITFLRKWADYNLKEINDVCKRHEKDSEERKRFE